VRLTNNQGRGAAINAGIAASTGEYVLITDSDCSYTDRHCLRRFIAAFESGADVVIGSVSGNGNDFWSQYFAQLQASREHRAVEQGIFLFTTANIGLRRFVLERIGGFNPEYKYYGFEDKELLLEIERHGFRTVIDPTIGVCHDATLSLRSIARKMQKCGSFSSTIFANRFPAEYRKLPYYRLDIRRYSPALARLGLILPILVAAVVLSGDHLLKLRWLPFPLKVALVKVASGLAYLHGTCIAVRLGESPSADRNQQPTAPNDHHRTG
jgi:glycosyltransferase involved in cell wall biosynthesis